MAALWSWFRLDLRRRWWSLLVLAVLVAFASGVVMTAVAGARRGATAVDRLFEQTLPATVHVRSFTPGFDWEPIRDLPEVEALTEIVAANFEIEGRPPPETIVFPPIDIEAMRTIERPVVLEGRLADPSRSDEVVVTPRFLETSGRRVGDTLTLGLYTPEQVDTAQTPFWLTAEQQEAALASGLDPNDVAPAGGPVLEATVVGVIRSPYFSDETGDVAGSVIPSVGLYTDYRSHLAGARGLAAIDALVRLDGGEAAVPAFNERLADLPVEVENLAVQARDRRSVASFEATGLMVFAAAAGAAALVVLWSAIARHVASTATSLHVLRTVGMTPQQSRRAAALGPTLAAAVGAVLGALGAMVASRWFPIGIASIVEPAPGSDLDLRVLLPGVFGVPLLVAIGAAVAAVPSVSSRSSRSVSSGRSVVATGFANAGLPVPVVVGAGFALERGSGREAVPVRPALAAAIVGVLGVIAALTFASGVDDAAANPAHQGAVYQVEAWVGFNDFAFSESPAAVLTALAEVPGVAGVNDTRHQLAAVGGVQVMVQSFDPVGAPLAFIVAEGRLPATATEILLGPQTADELGVGVGDPLAIAGVSGEADMNVVGLGLVAPMVMDHATGALVTPAGYDRLFDGFRGHVGFVALEPGVDPEGIIPSMYEAVALIPGDVGIQPLDHVAELDEFRHVGRLPLLLAGFLALLALAAVGNALATAVRRRRGEVAALRALGMTRWQSRGVVLTQAVVLAAAGLVVGIPLGIALGRTVWRYVADALYLHYVPPVAGLALILVVPTALLAANLLAAWPSQRAASMRLGEALRAE